MSWGKEIKCDAYRANYRFYAQSLINSNNSGAQIFDSNYNMTLEMFEFSFLFVYLFFVLFIFGEQMLSLFAINIRHCFGRYNVKL